LFFESAKVILKRGKIMRIILRSLIVMAAALATVLTSQAAAAAATVSVPFEFVANGKIMPAGMYYVARDDFSSFVTLTSQDSRRSYVWLLKPGDAKPGNAAIVLSFSKANGAYALRSIRIHGLITGQLDKRVFEAPAIRMSRVSPTRLTAGTQEVVEIAAR
jgi:hypothetical protein